MVGLAIYDEEEPARRTRPDIALAVTRREWS